MHSLIVRSCEMVEEMKDNMIFKCFYSDKYLRDFAVLEGLEIAKYQKPFNDFIVNFYINNSEKPFVLPQCGMSVFEYKGTDEKGIFIPLTEEIAIRLIDKRYINNYIFDGKMCILSSNQNSKIEEINNLAYSQQLNHGVGFIVSSSKEEIERLISTI